MRNIYLVALVLIGVILIGIGFSFAGCGSCGATSLDTAKAETKVIDVGNKICPVMNGPIDEATKATYEYDGKVYNFCCPACIETFKKDPAKYIEKVGQELKQN